MATLQLMPTVRRGQGQNENSRWWWSEERGGRAIVAVALRPLSLRLLQPHPPVSLAGAQLIRAVAPCHPQVCGSRITNQPQAHSEIRMGPITAASCGCGRVMRPAASDSHPPVPLCSFHPTDFLLMLGLCLALTTGVDALLLLLLLAMAAGAERGAARFSVAHCTAM